MLLKPLFRYSSSRSAYVLRGVGDRFGPVVVIVRPIAPGDHGAHVLDDHHHGVTGPLPGPPTGPTAEAATDAA